MLRRAEPLSLHNGRSSCHCRCCCRLALRSKICPPRQQSRLGYLFGALLVLIASSGLSGRSQRLCEPDEPALQLSLTKPVWGLATQISVLSSAVSTCHLTIILRQLHTVAPACLCAYKVDRYLGRPLKVHPSKTYFSRAKLKLDRLRCCQPSGGRLSSWPPPPPLLFADRSCGWRAEPGGSDGRVNLAAAAATTSWMIDWLPALLIPPPAWPKAEAEALLYMATSDK